MDECRGAQQGICPNCGNDDLSYDESELDSDSVSWDVSCESCDWIGCEYYDITYSTTYGEKPEEEVEKQEGAVYDR